MKYVSRKTTASAHIFNVSDPATTQPSGRWLCAKGGPFDTDKDIGDPVKPLDQLIGVMTHAHAGMNRQRWENRNIDLSHSHRTSSPLLRQDIGRASCRERV